LLQFCGGGRDHGPLRCVGLGGKLLKASLMCSVFFLVFADEGKVNKQGWVPIFEINKVAITDRIFGISEKYS
jgi:hypothetical protein